MKKIAVFLADGFEEGEGIFTVDIFRRAGFTVTTFAIKDKTVKGAHDIPVIADELLDGKKLEDYDLVFLPGGIPGATNLRDDERVISIVQAFDADPAKYVAAICAAPIILAKAGIVKGRRVTSYPGADVMKALKQAGGVYVDDQVIVKDGHLLTSRGPATAMPFAFAITQELGGDAKSVSDGMLYPMLRDYLK